MSNKPIIPEEELYENLTSFNEELLELFAIEHGHQKSYMGHFLRSKRNGNKEFYNYVPDDVLNHFVMLSLYKPSQEYYKNFMNHLRALRKTAAKHFPLEFSQDNLSEVDNWDIDSVIEARSKKNKKPMTVTQLDAARNYVQTDIKFNLLFELYFQLGIKKNQILSYKYENYNFDDRTFYDDDKKPLKTVTSYLHEIIKNSNREDFPNANRFSSNLVPKLTQYLVLNKIYPPSRNFTYEDIKLTRKNFFLKCPYCGMELENKKENWVLLQVGDTGSVRLCCVVCKGEVPDESASL